MTTEELIRKYLPGVQSRVRGGSDGDPGEEYFVGPGSEYAQNLIEWDSMLNQVAGSPGGMNIDPARRDQILRDMLASGRTDVVNYNANPFLTSQETQGMNQWGDYVNQENASKSFGDYLAMGAFGAGLAGMGGLAFGGLGAAPGAETVAGDAAWGVNPATNEYSLAGGTAGNASGGLYSGAGGVTGITPAGAGVTGLTGTATGGALLTPAMAASIGLPASAAMGGTGATAAQAMGGAANAAWGVNPGSALSRIMNNEGTPADWTQILGTAAGSGLGVAGAKAQGDAYQNVADKYLAMGAPFRDKLLATYQPGYSIADSPDFKNAMEVGSEAAARATSARVGNPVGNPGAYADMQKYIIGSLALPQLNTTRSQLGTFGQLGTNVAGQNDTNAAAQTGGMYNAIGYGIGQATQPDSMLNNKTLSNLLLNSSKFLA